MCYCVRGGNEGRGSYLPKWVMLQVARRPTVHLWPQFPVICLMESLQFLRHIIYNVVYCPYIWRDSKTVRLRSADTRIIIIIIIIIIRNLYSAIMLLGGYRGARSLRFLWVARWPTSATEPSVQLDLQSGTSGTCCLRSVGSMIQNPGPATLSNVFHVCRIVP